MSTHPTSEEQNITRRRTFDVRGDEEILEVIRIARSERVTGTVTVHLGNGKEQAATVEERAKLPRD